jgi:hypothetical protein
MNTKSRKNDKGPRQFLLTGKVGYLETHTNSDDYWVGPILEKEFKAMSLTEAIDKARMIVDEFLKTNHRRGPESDPNATFDFSLAQVVWTNNFVPAQKAVSPIPKKFLPAKHGRPEVLAYSEEVLLGVK